MVIGGGRLKPDMAGGTNTHRPGVIPIPIPIAVAAQPTSLLASPSVLPYPARVAVGSRVPSPTWITRNHAGSRAGENQVRNRERSLAAGRLGPGEGGRRSSSDEVAGPRDGDEK